MSKTDRICQETDPSVRGLEKWIDCSNELQSNHIGSSLLGRAKWRRLSLEILCVLLATALLPQTNENKALLENFDTDQEMQNESDQRLSNSSSDLGPLGLMEKHAPAVYEILDDPEWQELDEIGRYRVLVPELRNTWGSERSSSKELVETLNSIEQQIATGKQKRLARNAKRILGFAQDKLFDQYGRSLDWIVYLKERWKKTEFGNAIPAERLNDHLDCIESCESKLYKCFVQAESDFEQDVIVEIEKALTEPVKNRSLVRKWRGRSPHSAATGLFLSMYDCHQDLLQRGGWDCDRRIFFDIKSPAAKVELPEESVNEPKPESSQEESQGGSFPGAS
ncbi:MAG: hypothetical protein F4X44_03315 [Gammaproteobacteria bacterium]|nr:hypothetical protein [Gammaproteobacteria bacterium]MYD79624.1 hypothetical protein [Gammaproteobacteria bacterium]